ncbi:MAG: AzlD domain-containing protein [Hominimerdicola sp.]
MISIHDFFIYLFIMAGVTYLIRALPFVIFKGEIKNKFAKSFLYYVPYAVLSAMTFPAVIFSTGSIISAVAGLIVACILAFKEKSLLTVAIFACLAVLAVDLIGLVFT